MGESKGLSGTRQMEHGAPKVQGGKNEVTEPKRRLQGTDHAVLRGRRNEVTNSNRKLQGTDPVALQGESDIETDHVPDLDLDLGARTTGATVLEGIREILGLGTRPNQETISP
jgi:hypothetical protein